MNICINYETKIIPFYCTGDVQRVSQLYVLKQLDIEKRDWHPSLPTDKKILNLQPL